MNYFGLFFTFMLPGLVLGAMAAVVYQTEKQKKSKRQRTNRVKTQKARNDKLFVYDLMQDAKESAA